jgi:hypothetical protein
MLSTILKEIDGKFLALFKNDYDSCKKNTNFSSFLNPISFEVYVKPFKSQFNCEQIECIAKFIPEKHMVRIMKLCEF